MRFSVLGDLNWLAVIVATVSYFVLAGPWFAEATLGPAWRRSIGWDKAPGQRLGPDPVRHGRARSDEAAPAAWFGIMAGYHVLGLLIASVIVSVWT